MIEVKVDMVQTTTSERAIPGRLVRFQRSNGDRFKAREALRRSLIGEGSD